MRLKYWELHLCLRYSWWPVNNDSIFLHSRSRSLKIQDGRHASLSIKTLHLEFLHFSVINGDKDVNIRVYDDARFCGRLKNVIRWQCTKKYKMAAVSRNYNFYCKWRLFWFFSEKNWKFSWYLSFLWTAHPRKHTNTYLNYCFCKFILNTVTYSRFGEEIFRHFGFTLIWGLSSQDKNLFWLVLYSGGS